MEQLEHHRELRETEDLDKDKEPRYGEDVQDENNKMNKESG
jgi:hypothetical protein